jgi:hypothetical protein
MEYLAQHGPVEDPAGKATSKLRESLSYDGSEASFTQLVANMDRAGQVTRDIKGKRTYRIEAIAPESGLVTPDSGDALMDYDQVASALLVQVVQALTKDNKSAESDGSWARRRIERHERRISELEHELSAARAETKSLTAERDQLRVQLEHSEGNLALLAERHPNGKPRDEQVSKLLNNDERALLHQLRSSVVKVRPERAS